MNASSRLELTVGAEDGERLRSDISARIHAIVMGTTCLGPGYRAAVWFQGCPFRCTGCIAPDALEFDGGTVLDVQDIISAVDSDSRIEGITCSGGEPFAQPRALAAILAGLRNLRRGAIVFSGYTLEHLYRRADSTPAIGEALGLTDVLIDGMYVDGRNTGESHMRGSDNQRIHFLTDRYVSDRAYFENYHRDRFEIRTAMGGDAMLVGVPSRRTGEFWTILADGGNMQ